MNYIGENLSDHGNDGDGDSDDNHREPPLRKQVWRNSNNDENYEKTDSEIITLVKTLIEKRNETIEITGSICRTYVTLKLH